MKVILLQDIERLGKKTSVVEVKDGYARNYLFPKKLALPLTPENLSFLEQMKLREERLFQKKKEEAFFLAKKLSSLSLTITCEAKDNEELFGSVNPGMISRALEMEGVSIPQEKISLPEPIKKLGIFKVKVRLHPEVETEVEVWVVRK